MKFFRKKEHHNWTELIEIQQPLSSDYWELIKSYPEDFEIML